MRLITGLTVAALLAGSASAATLDDKSGALAIGEGLRALFGGLLGPADPASPITALVEGDHVRLTIPLPRDGAPAQATAVIRPADGQAWTVDSVQLPTPNSTTLQSPAIDGVTPPPTKLTSTIGTQSATGRIDPSRASASVLDQTLGGVTVAQEGGNTTFAYVIESVMSHFALSPIADGRTDAGQTFTAGPVGIEIRETAGSLDKIEIKRVAIRSNLTGVDPARVATANSVLRPVLLGMAASDPKARQHLTDEQRAQLHAALVALHDIARAGDITTEINGFVVPLPTRHSLTIGAFSLGMAFDARDTGSLSANMGLDGIVSDAMPPPFVALTPRNNALSLTLGNVDLATLTTMAMNATATPPVDPTPADAQALLTRAVLTLDRLTFETGGAHVTATGRAAADASGLPSATIHIAATGFDALTTTMQTTPGLQQGLAVIGIARATARPDPTTPNGLLWDVVWSPQGTTINGIDAASMVPGARPAQPGPAQRAPSQPAPPPSAPAQRPPLNR